MTPMETQPPHADSLQAPTPAFGRVASATLRAAAVFTLTASLIVAVGGFTWGLPDDTHIQSYHPDEQNITYSLRNMNPRDFDFNPRFFGNPTFYTYQVGAAALAGSLTGLLPAESSPDYWLSHPEAVRRFYILGRSISLAYAALSLWLVYIVALRLTKSRRGALLAAAVFGCLPAFAVHSHYMSVNSSAVFWSLAAVLFALKLRENPSWRNYILAGLCAGLAISTKFNNAFLVFAVLASHIQSAKSRPWMKTIFAGRLWLTGLASFAAFFAGSPYYILSWAAVRADPHSRMNMAALFDFSAPVGTTLADFWNHLSAACGWALAVAFLLVVPAALLRRRRRQAPILAVAVPFLLISIKSGFWAFPSRMLPLLALLAILVAVLWDDQRTRGTRRAVFSFALSAVFLATFPWHAAYYNLIRSQHIRSESSRWIVHNIPPGARIIVLDTPYFEAPDIVYENARRAQHTIWPIYEIADLARDFGALASTEGHWLVVPERLERRIRAETGATMLEYAASNGFQPATEFTKDFSAFGVELRDWIPADMIQDYPVFLFHRGAQRDAPSD